MKILVLPMSTEPILLRPAHGHRTRYLLERPDGMAVPLIPADELPDDIKLAVKRAMTMDEAFALGIQVVTFESETQRAKTSDQPSPTGFSERPKARIANAVKQTKDDASLEVNDASDSEVDTKAKPRWPPTQSAPTSKQQYRPAGDPPKRYCSYWIHYGSCDFEQQGCKFLHEMPDQDTLRAIGFRTTPRWWLNKALSDRIKHSGKTGDERRKHTKPFSNVSQFPTWRSREVQRPSDHSSSVTCTPDSSCVNLIDLSPGLHPVSCRAGVGNDGSSDIDSIQLGRPMIEDLPNMPSHQQAVPTQHLTDRVASLMIEQGRKLEEACFIRRRGGQREAWVPSASKKSRRGKRGGRTIARHREL